ncbi:unnamed protein product [Paramecium sonneborni]|uniref:Myb-like DNA-binding domain protein n=1 Tax=Paramecium sonneborni TaxID=65129 RepID=A0A8S1QX28_9CILI|nr:unnamed protein product [Paramecium sonneborni]
MKNQNHIETKQKRKPWIIEEDILLQKLVENIQKEKLEWKNISQTFKEQGYDRDTKACRERFQNHLDKSYNKSYLTEKEIDRLFDYLELYGNKWTYIAEQLNNRTDQDIKNNFYAHVKRIIRRLIKATYKTTESSFIIAKIQPYLISSIYCHDNEDNEKMLKLDSEMKVLFKYLIRNNKKIEVGVKLNEQTKEKVKKIINYLGEQNDIYIKKKINKKIQKVKAKKSKQKRRFKLQLGLNNQKRIIEKIQKMKPIFTTQNIKIEKFKFFKNIVQKEEEIQIPYFGLISLDKMYSFQPYLNPLMASTSFCWRQPSNILSIDSMISSNFLFGFQGNHISYSIGSDSLRVFSN